MKTKHRILSVLTILALVASLTAVMAAPAAATGAAEVTVMPRTAGHVGAAYAIRYIAPAVVPPGGLITVTFPLGTTVPAVILPAHVTIALPPAAPVAATAVAVLVRTVVITSPVGFAAGAIVDLVFAPAAGITNPPVPGTYTLTVAGITSEPYPIGGITIAPTAGVIGTPVTITGAGFVHPGPAVALTIGGIGAPLVPAAPVAAGGVFTVTRTVPTGLLPGPNPIIATQVVDGIVVVSHSVPFTIPVPSITLAPISGLRGTAVTVTGVGFPRLSPGTISAPGVIHAVAFETTTVGAIPATTVTILGVAPLTPPAPPATFTATVGGVTATATFTVTPPPVVPVATIALSPTIGGPGTPVTVTGSGFPPGTAGIITPPGVIAPVAFATTAEGTIPTVPPTVVTILPDAPVGLATITVTVGPVSAGAPFHVLPAPPVIPPVPTVSLVADPLVVPLVPRTAGARGTAVAVTGVHFPPGTTGVIMAPGVIHPIGFITTAVGTFATVAPHVPILAAAPFGPATFTVTVGVVSATATFTVHAPAVTLAPVGGLPGATVLVTGVGFPPGAPGLITAPGVILPVPTPITTAVGTFPATPIIILPGVPLVPVPITVTVTPPPPGIPVTATATYTVGITPSITLSPTIGFEGTVVTVTGFGFPALTPGTITAAPAGVIAPASFTTTAVGAIPPVPVPVPVPPAPVPPALRTILIGAPVGAATFTVTVGAVSATAVFIVAGPGVPIVIPEPVVPVLKGLEPIIKEAGEAVWEFREGRWFRFHTDPAIHALIPAADRLTELVSGRAYWIFLTADIPARLLGGVTRPPMKAGWHNIGWVL